MDTFTNALAAFSNYFVSIVWDKPVTFLCLFSALFFTARFGFIQLRGLKHSLELIRGKYDAPDEVGHINHFQALSAALSGTVGLGNIAGVAIAIAAGGPGAVFWMWVMGFLGMATKFVECSLGTIYREENEETGEVRGGPMYYIVNGLGKKWKWMAVLYAVLIGLAGFGTASMFQANQAAHALYNNYNIPVAATGIFFVILSGIVILGGIKRIGQVASKVVPLMCSIYLIGAASICVLNADLLPEAIKLIVQDAFTGKAIGGGIFYTMMMGIRRAIFSNEAGLGSAAIAHSAVKTNYPIREGYVALLGPLIDTLIVCSATAFVIILSGSFGVDRYESVPTPFLAQKQIASYVPANTNWYMSNDAPKSKSKLIRYHSGDPILATKGAALSSPIAIPLDIKTKDGIKFSYFKVSGGMDLYLVNLNTRTQMAHLKFKDDEGVSIVESKGTKLEGAHIQNEWGRASIKFSPEIKEAFSEKNQLALYLVPSNANSKWYFDQFSFYNITPGIELTIRSFDTFYRGFGTHFITLAVFLFAFSTMVTWSYYGETAAGFLLGRSAITIYKWTFVALAFVGSILSLDTVINLSDGVLGLIVIPNFIALILLTKKLGKMLKSYQTQLKGNEFKTYS